MAHRTAIDCDWCGKRDVPREEQVRIGVKCCGAEMETPVGAALKIEGELNVATWIEVCDECAEKAEAAVRVWAREEQIHQVEARRPKELS